MPRATQFTLSTMSICSIEDVAAAVGKPFWFQLYVMKDRGFVRSLIERAAAARCSALVLTVDLPVLGQRHSDVKNGLSVPPSLKLHNLLDMATKPAWVVGVLQASVGRSATSTATSREWPTSVRSRNGSNPIRSIAQLERYRLDPDLWPGKLILKGILDVDDARPPQSPKPPRSSSRITAADSSTAPRPPFRCSRSCRRRRFRRRSDVRWRHSLWPRCVACARAWRKILPDWPRLHLRCRRRRGNGRR